MNGTTKSNLASALKSPLGDLGVKVQYFKFEEDFVEDNVRCIPMIVRFKLDACGIKLKLTEWCKMSTQQRILLADLPCESTVEVAAYEARLRRLIKSITNQNATDLKIDRNPQWAQLTEIPAILIEKVRELDMSLSLAQWKDLNTLQRFALLKLSSSSHENKNFPKALREFNVA